jgi:hypothetical protein
LISLVTHSAYSQSSLFYTGIGGKAGGMGYTTACLRDDWSLFNNAAGLSFVKKATISTSYDARPQLVGANRMAFIASVPSAVGTGALGFYKFGDDLYNEQKVSLGFSNRLGLASLGASLNYLQFQAMGFGTKSLITFNLGGIASLAPNFFIGAHIQNVNQPVLSESSQERISTLLALGLGFAPTEKVWLSTEIQKELENQSTYKLGLEYKPVKKFAARTGFNLRPNKLFAGIGFITHRLTIDYAYEYAPNGLGSSHQASLGYQLKTK